MIDRNHFVEKNKGIKVNPLHNDNSCIEDEISPNTESDYMENYKPFISEGVVSLVGDENSSQKVKILRDTGAIQSLMLESVLPLTENSFTGANVLISGVEMGVLEVPLHEVNIKVGGYSIRVIARQIKCRHLERDWHTTRFITVHFIITQHLSARPDKSGTLIPSYVFYA